MKEILPVLQNAPIFRGISREEIVPLLACLNTKTSTHQKGDYILRVGDSVESVGMLLSGSALISQEDFWGNRNLISQVTAGQLFGESFACSPGSVINFCVVADHPCAVMWLNVNCILTTCPTACSHHSRMIRNLLSDLAGKNLNFTEKLGHMAQRTTREKLMSYLSAEAQRHASAEFDIPFDRQQLADYLSVDRSAMSSELGKLRDDGVLISDKKHFILLKARED